jgi:hypothetical protein
LLELIRELDKNKVSWLEQEAATGVSRLVSTQLGPMLALTSWANVLSMLEHEAVDDPSARGDLVQLRALCDAADNEAFIPFSRVELSDQRTPAFILQLNSLVQATVDSAVTEKALSVNKLRPQASGERIGRYVYIRGEQVAGAWLGIHFGLWKSHGATPLWLLFSEGEFGRAQDVRRLIETWAATNGVLTITYNREFAIALDMPIGEEKTVVIRFLVDIIKNIAAVLDALPSKTLAIVDQE